MSKRQEVPGAIIQRQREADELANHQERVQWLSCDKPAWADGTPVDEHSRHVLLLQSQAAIANAKAGPV